MIFLPFLLFPSSPSPNKSPSKLQTETIPIPSWVWNVSSIPLRFGRKSPDNLFGFLPKGTPKGAAITVTQAADLCTTSSVTRSDVLPAPSCRYIFLLCFPSCLPASLVWAHSPGGEETTWTMIRVRASSSLGELAICLGFWRVVVGRRFSMVRIGRVAVWCREASLWGGTAGEYFRQDMIGMRLPRSVLRLVIWLLDGAHSWCEGGSSQLTRFFPFRLFAFARRASRHLQPLLSRGRLLSIVDDLALPGGRCEDGVLLHIGGSIHEEHFAHWGITHTRDSFRALGATQVQMMITLYRVKH